jgi:hypothetical protein
MRATRCVEGVKMAVSVELTDSEIARLKALTHSHDDAVAVTTAAREYLRLVELRQLKSASGRVDFSLDGEELERLELAELESPTK